MPLPFSDWHHSDRDLKRTFIRKTYWTNGEVSEREVECSINELPEFIDIQRRKIANGPGIDAAAFYYNKRCYLVLTKPGCV